jgi:hypothetical protein
MTVMSIGRIYRGECKSDHGSREYWQDRRAEAKSHHGFFSGSAVFAMAVIFFKSPIAVSIAAETEP